MAEKFEIEVPINEGGGNVAGAGVSPGKSAAKDMEKSMKSIGLGKMAGKLGVIAIVLDAMSFIIKPVMSMLKIILMLLFLPLIPILKPVMKGLAAFIKWFAPIMKKFAGHIEKLVGALGEGLTWIWENLLKPIWDGLVSAFEIFKDFGMWIWEKLIKPGMMFLADLGLKLWGVLKEFFTGQIDIIKEVWGYFKSFFKGDISVVDLVWGLIKSFFKGTINVATLVWNWFKTLFTGAKKLFGFQAGGVVPGPIGAPQLAVVHGGETITPAGGGKIIVNINHPSVRSDQDIKTIANEVSRVLQRHITGRIASG